jgi:hypothetical protein
VQLTSGTEPNYFGWLGDALGKQVNGSILSDRRIRKGAACGHDHRHRIVGSQSEKVTAPPIFGNQRQLPLPVELPGMSRAIPILGEDPVTGQATVVSHQPNPVAVEIWDSLHSVDEGVTVRRVSGPVILALLFGQQLRPTRFDVEGEDAESEQTVRWLGTVGGVCNLGAVRADIE